MGDLFLPPFIRPFIESKPRSSRCSRARPTKSSTTEFRAGCWRSDTSDQNTNPSLRSAALLKTALSEYSAMVPCPCIHSRTQERLFPDGAVCAGLQKQGEGQKPSGNSPSRPGSHQVLNDDDWETGRLWEARGRNPRHGWMRVREGKEGSEGFPEEAALNL